MKSTNWVCNACYEPNLDTLNKCAKCNCPKGANGEVTQQFQNPDLYHSKKASKSLNTTLALIITSPVFLLTAIHQGNLIFFALFLGSIISILIINKPFLTVLTQSKWAIKVLLFFVIFNFISFSLRLLFDDDLTDNNLFLLVVIDLVMYALFFAYIKYSQKGIQFLNDYKTKYQS